MPSFVFWIALVGCPASVSARTFVHPGALDSKAELDFVKAQIRAGAQPWTGEFDRLRHSGFATRRPHGRIDINSNSPDAEVSRDDATAAYTQALLWYFTDDATYARRSIAILDSWATLKAFTAGSDQDRLQAGWIGAVFANAAEIMRLYPGWTSRKIGHLQAMFRRAFYPQLNTASRWNGNVDLTQIDAMMAISVFNDDGEEFNQGLVRLKVRIPAYFYLRSDGPAPKPINGDGGDSSKFWHQPIKWVDGLTQETCRDNGHHSQFALGSALHAAEVAWHQGTDVYSEYKDRLTAAMELLAAQFLSGSMLGVCPNDIPSPDRFDTWEVGYNHYHNRAGMALPNTRRVILEQIRPHARRSDWNLIYETLTHADLPAHLSPCGGTFGCRCNWNRPEPPGRVVPNPLGPPQAKSPHMTVTPLTPRSCRTRLSSLSLPARFSSAGSTPTGHRRNSCTSLYGRTRAA